MVTHFQVKYLLKEAFYDTLYDFMEGWKAYVKQAATYHLRQKLLLKFGHGFWGEISAKEVSRNKSRFSAMA